MNERNKQVVIDAWKTFASRDAARIGAGFTENAEWIAPEGNATAVALNCTHHMIGHEAIATFIAIEFPKLFVADVSVDFSGIYCDADTVIVEERMKATLAGGHKYDNSYCFFFELSDGRISKVREYMDTQRGRRCIFG